MNAANEVAVQAFLDGEIPFTAITEIVGDVLMAHVTKAADSIETVLSADRAARDQARLACSALHPA